MGLKSKFFEKIKFITDITPSVDKVEKQDELRKKFKESVENVYELDKNGNDLVIKIENLANGQSLDDKDAKKKILAEKKGPYKKIEEMKWNGKTIELIDEVYRYMETGESEDARVSIGKSLLRQLVKNDLNQNVEIARLLGMEFTSLTHLSPDAVLSEEQKKKYGDLPTYVEARKDEIEKSIAVIKRKYAPETELTDREIMLIEDQSKPVISMLSKDESDLEKKIRAIESRLSDEIDRCSVMAYGESKKETEALLTDRRGNSIVLDSILSEENVRESEPQK